MTTSAKLHRHLSMVRDCSACPDMVGPVVVGEPVASKIMIVGQAPGPNEGAIGKPFAWTAGKTLFSWFSSIGLDEEGVRSKIFISAVCRCFPGKAKGGGDRVPGPLEIEQCSRWLRRELEILQPRLIIPIGKLAIVQFIPVKKLDEVVGKKFSSAACPGATIVPLPHPSGASTWFKTETGKRLLGKALALISEEPEFRSICG